MSIEVENKYSDTTEIIDTPRYKKPVLPPIRIPSIFDLT